MAEPRTLLHVCCAPCAITPVSWLAERGIPWSGFFFNPNIHPRREHDLRLRETLWLAQRLDWRIETGEAGVEEWFAEVKGLAKEPERGLRCERCFAFRLERAFVYARQYGFAQVTTTLTVSPFKPSPRIFSVGKVLAERYGIPFLAVDFKKNDGFAKGRAQARKLGLRIQTHCGCVYSLVAGMLRRRGGPPREP